MARRARRAVLTHCIPSLGCQSLTGGQGIKEERNNRRKPPYATYPTVPTGEQKKLRETPARRPRSAETIETNDNGFRMPC